MFETKPTNPIEGDLCYENGLIEIYSSGRWCQFIAHRDISNIINSIDRKTSRLNKIKKLFE